MAIHGARLPAASRAYRGVEAVALADARGSLLRLPHTIGSPDSGTLHVRFKTAGLNCEYVLHPQCLRNSAGALQVVVYVAVNPKGASTSGDYYVGPGEVDWFAERAATLLVAAGQLYGISGQVRPYEVHTSLMIDSMLHGKVMDGIEHFGLAWRAALRDPNWYMMAVPALGVAALQSYRLAAGGASAARTPGPLRGAAAATLDRPPLPRGAGLRVSAAAASRALPAEAEMIQMLKLDGAVADRGVLMRNLKGKFVIRAEGFADKGPGNFFNGPFDSLEQAQAVARRMASSESALRQENALARQWNTKGEISAGSRCEVVRVYRVDYDAPGIRSVIAPQPEGGTVMVRPQHLEAIARRNPTIAYEWRGGGGQVELPVGRMRTGYGVDIVQRMEGSEYPVKADGTGF